MDPNVFVLPRMSLPSRLQGSLPVGVLLDVCFLAYLNKEFCLCETTARIEARLYGEQPCWEKRWARMLYRWREREEMDWEDLPLSIKPSEHYLTDE